MGCTWGNPTPPASPGTSAPRPIRDGTPATLAETVLVSVLVTIIGALAVWAMWAAGHRMGDHLERLCNAGSAYGCAADGRHP